MMKASQPSVNYGRGDPINHCGICVYMQGYHSCSKVGGDISPYGLCDLYKPQPTPFGKTMAPAEIAAVKRMAADAADRSAG